jgi:uncharacterized protein (TIGR02145 family)
MNKVLVFAVSAFLLSCADVELERNNPYDALAYNYVGNAPAEGSSSSVVYGTPVTYGSETYQTVVIGTQTWMVKNLNYDVSGSKCYNNSSNNCTEYGKLYNWTTAMNLPSGSNQIQTKHQGICPAGWHIPSYAEWNTLSSYVQSNSGCSNCDARLLKAASGWSNNGNGTNEHGFSALPGGYGNSDVSFLNVGYGGYWWSARGENNSDHRYMLYNGDYADWGIYGAYLYSVRCLQD